MARPRTTYATEFKRAAVQLTTEQKLSVAEDRFANPPT